MIVAPSVDAEAFDAANAWCSRYFLPLVWLITAGGFLALYLPAYVEAWDVIWQTDDHAHGPIVLAVVALAGLTPPITS